MRILHYALGFPPYRSGGLTKFCIDLMAQQSKEGHTVAMLWPGEMCYFNHVPMIKKHNDVKLAKQLVQSFELVNPLPVPLDEGIADIAAFIKDDGKKAYERLIKCFRPDVIHVHTLMGIHKSFLDTARERGVRLVFSAHDFFPICSKVTMYHNNTLCNCVRDCGNCGVCNITALNLRKIQILQSPLYRGLKDSALVKKLRTKHRTRYLSKAGSDISAKSVAKASQYQELREYYYALLKMMDLIHYNSSVTKAVYETYFTFSNTRSITITHSGILDKRARKSFSEDTIRIRYLGPQSAGKGFYLLESALDMLWNERKNFCLDVHFTPIEKKPYIQAHGRYGYDELKQIFDETDILIVPSAWYETFGYTALEALSYGVPVIISGTIGAKDILVEGTGIIIDDITSEALYEVLRNIKRDDLIQMNRTIVEKQPIMLVGDMSRKIETECYGWKV